MKAVILAAGRSTRLYPLTLDRPKCLLEVAGKTLLEHQMDALAKCGIDELVIVTGYLREQIEEKIDEVKARYPFSIPVVYTPRYAETNNLHSLCSAERLLINKDFLCLHADVLFHPDILVGLALTDGDFVLAAERRILQETMKLQLDGRRVKSVGKHIGLDEASATFPGLAKFSAAGSKMLFAEIRELVDAGNTNAYFTLAVNSLIGKNREVLACFTNNLPWIEIDVAEELAEANALAWV